MQDVSAATLITAEHSDVVYRQRSNPHSSALRLLSHGSYHLAPGAVSDPLGHPGRELLLFAMEGTVAASVHGTRCVMRHYDVLYVPVGTSYELANLGTEPAHLYAFMAPADAAHPVYFAAWAEVSRDEKRIRHLQGKDVFLMFDVSEGAEKLMAGYTIYQPHTRAFPPHNHTDQEEIYLFCQGHGAIEVYPSEELKTFVTSVGPGDSVSIPVLNFHPVFSQEAELHFIWCIAGARYWVGDKNKAFMQGRGAAITT